MDSDDTKAAPLALAEEAKRLASEYANLLGMILMVVASDEPKRRAMCEQSKADLHAVIDRLAAAASPPQPVEAVGSMFRPEDIARAVMTKEQEAAVRDRGWCWKCAATTVVDVHSEGGIRWLQCKHCKTIYALAAPPAVEAGQALTEPAVQPSAQAFVVYGKEPGLEYSVRTADGRAVCTCAYNPESHDDRRRMAMLITEALNRLAASPQASPTVETNSLGVSPLRGAGLSVADAPPIPDAARERLHRFLNAAAGEGFVLDGVDAADLYIELFPAEYEATINKIDGGTHD